MIGSEWGAGLERVVEKFSDVCIFEQKPVWSESMDYVTRYLGEEEFQDSTFKGTEARAWYIWELARMSLWREQSKPIESY